MLRLFVARRQLINFDLSPQDLRRTPPDRPRSHRAIGRRQEAGLVDLELLAQPEVRDEHLVALRRIRALLRARGEDVLRLDVAVDDLQRVQMPQNRGEFAYCTFRLKRPGDGTVGGAGPGAR